MANVKYPAGRSRIPSEQPAPKPPPDLGVDLVLTAPEDAQKRRRNQQLEHAEQKAYFDQVNAAVAQARPGAALIFAIPNGTAAGRGVGAKMVREGVRRGVPDIFVAVPSNRAAVYAGLFIEMKKAAGVLSDVTPEQAAWHERLRDMEYRVCVCFGWREAMAVTREYLGWTE